MERKRIDGKRRSPSGAAVLQDRVTEALTRAFFREWAEEGYRGISLEQVASRAEVGKAALYRRWPSKEAMAIDLVGKASLEMAELPDGGSLDREVRAWLREFRRTLRHPLVRRIFPDFLAIKDRTPAMREAAERLGRARRQRGAGLVARAIARGELSATCDPELAADLLAGPLYWRVLVIRRPLAAADMERLAVAIIAGLRAC